MFNKAILHLDLDAFFVSVECLKNKALIGKPILIGGLGSSGLLASCSYEAQHFGVHPAMPMKMARRLCPQAIVIKGDMDNYSYYSKLVTEVIKLEAPVFEKASIDEFYLDLTGMDKYFGCLQWSNELRRRLMGESGLPISFGLSVNKLVSKVGTGEAKPNGTKYIPAGTEKDFLAPLSTRKIPGIGKDTYKHLSFMGVRTIRILGAIPIQMLEREFGQFGRKLWQYANAIDARPVVPYNEQKSMSKERVFTEDTLDLLKAKDLLFKMVDELAFDLRTINKLTSCVTVKIRYADFNTHNKQRLIAYTANNKILLRHVKELFDTLYERRQLIRLVGVKFSGLVHGHYQINLFDDTVEEVQLLQQVDRIRRRFGKEAVGPAVYLN